MLTEQDFERIVELHGKKYSDAEIASILHKSEQTIKTACIKLRKAGKLKYKISYWSEEDDTVLIEGLKEKIGYKEIAKRLNKSLSACKSRAVYLRKDKKHKIPYLTESYSATEEEKIVEVYTENPWTEGARIYNSWAKKNGYKVRDKTVLHWKAKNLLAAKSARIDRSAEWLTTMEIAEVLGIDRDYSLVLTEKFKHILEPKWARNEGGKYLIRIKNLAKFLRSEEGVVYLKRFWHKLDKDYILFLLGVIK